MKKYNVNTQNFVIGTQSEGLARAAIQELGEKSDIDRHGCPGAAQEKQAHWVIKAQILAGGRGKGKFLGSNLNGGVHILGSNQTTDILTALLDKMFLHRLVTAQTSPEGVLVQKIMIARAVDIKQEAYFAILLDRQSSGAILLGSPKGGMDIEAVARDYPEALFKESVKLDMHGRLDKEQAESFVQKLQFPANLTTEGAEQIRRLYDLFIQNDALQVEVNPLAIASLSTGANSGPGHKVMAIDAKIQIDENAFFRQRELFSHREDMLEQDSREIQAAASALNYIGLDGDIGCLVNGAGLAMATMDMIQLEGGKPANFLDVGGNANKHQVKEAFKILSGDPRVKAILINIFGGIMRCDIIASGILDALEDISTKMPPIVVRLSGTNATEGLKLLSDSVHSIYVSGDMESAAKLSVQLASPATIKSTHERECDHENALSI